MRNYLGIALAMMILGLLLATTYLASPSSAVGLSDTTQSPPPSAVMLLTPTPPASTMAGPDLIIESITYGPTQPAIGTGVNITITIKNQGIAAASGFYTHLYVDPVDQPPNSTTPHTSRTYLGVPLNPGASYVWVRTGHTFATAGNHVVYAWVDRDNSVPESDETNNLAGPVNICVGGDCNAPDNYEPDDICGQASPITTDGVEQTHNLYPAPDKDWAWFSAVGGVTYRIQALADGADADLVVELHSTCASPPSFGSGAEIEFTAPANGVYYVKVEHNQAEYGPDTAYRLKVTAQNACNAHYEPNNGCNIASAISVGETAQLHSFCEAGDVDWTAFNTQAGTTYVISATNLGPQVDAQLSLFLTCADPPAFGSGQRIEYTAVNAGTIYVKAENLNSEQFGAGTDYRLQVTQKQPCASDVFENDNAPATAKPIIANAAVQSRNFCPSGDVDWVSFTTTAGVTYTLESFNLGLGTDTTVCLYDASGTQSLFCDDDGGAGKGSRVTWEAPAGGVYTARVTNQDTTAAGPATLYDLRLIAGLCMSDSAEPDNTRANARMITADGNLYPRNTCPARDVDWFAFNVNAGSYVIETAALGSEADTFIELYNASGTQLAFNDDYGPGEASRIHFVFGSAGVYYLQVRQFNPVQYGTGTEYAVRVSPGEPSTPTPTPTPPPTVTPTPPPPQSGVRTLILVNQAQLIALHGESATTQLMPKLEALAAHTNVDGEIIRLDLNHSISTAYAAWTSDLTNVNKANAVTTAIRSVIMTYWQQNDGIEYVVLVGDDRAIPFRRIEDNTPRTDNLERHYLRVDETHPTGAALHNNYYLTDDYYVDREPTSFMGRELYLPDLAVGRLIETPAEIGAFVDTFLAGNALVPGKVLVTAYDFVQDTAHANCADWQAEYGAANVDCSLIGDSWSLNDYRVKQLQANPPFKLQSINGHANHYQEGAPGFGQSINAQEIAGATADLSRGLIYTLGCHSGLNVPPSNSQGPLDLAQAFAQKRANYVGNTGFGWGLRGAIGLSEKLMRLYTEELRRDMEVSMGKALAAAKQRYYQQGQDLNGYDEKILQESIFYGLPMYRLVTTAAFSTGDLFPSVNLVSGLPGPNFGDDAVISGTISLNLIGALGPGDILELVSTEDGAYYNLDGHATTALGQPIQPLFFTDISVSQWPVRSVVFKGGSYETITDFDPVIAAPVNDYMTQTVESIIDREGWHPALPVGIKQTDVNDNLIVQLGQYDATTEHLRLYSALDFDLYYSLSTDQHPPTVTVVTALYNVKTNQISLKVGAVDETGVSRVVLNYTAGAGEWRSLELEFDANTYKWYGSFAGDLGSRYFVQAVDAVGNAEVVDNKGRYFAPVMATQASAAENTVYLPMVMRY